MADGSVRTADKDPQETREWLDALTAVLQEEGPERAHFLLEALQEKARLSGAYIPFSPNTAYINTIPPYLEDPSPGDHELEWKIRSLTRWNAMAMVVRANHEHDGIGGHIASFGSSATLYDVGFNHFWKGPKHPDGADLIYFQGHSSPGFYARAYLEGRLTEKQLLRFRTEASGPGLSSYPHPWLMPEFWQFSTVSMGLGPIMSIYQARLMKYLHNRGIADNSKRKVWCFCGDGEMDEPESLGAIGVAAREKLDNLIFVINCNLQRLDGPVRGNGKIIQELEGVFRGVGWNVIKVIWGGLWDGLIARDRTGLLIKAFNETVDGEYQACKARGGKYTREHFFGKYPELLKLVSSMSDKEIGELNRGGHDPHKVYAAFAAAVRHTGTPTLILTQTVKGYGMGDAGEGQNITHQQKKMSVAAMRAFRDRFEIPVDDKHIENWDLFYKPPEDAPEMRYMHERRDALGGSLPFRRTQGDKLEIPPLSIFKRMLDGTGDRGISTTMAYAQSLQILLRDKNIGPRIVPIVPDEARTFGMEGLFRQIGIYSSVGQKYTPEDADQLAFYKESKTGQVLQEGITEAGSMASFIAAATSYSNHGVTLIPFYAFYSIMGFHRFADLAWAAGDMRARGFLLGGTAGRTTINGEGLQHEDGHSHLTSSTIPNLKSYDPAWAYEVAVIFEHGMRDMYVEQHDHFYYLTLNNQNYPHPAMPKGVEDGIMKGLYLFRGCKKPAKAHVQLLGSGVIILNVIKAAELLEKDWGVTAEIWSAPSFTELARDGHETDRWNMLHPDAKKPRVAYVTQCLQGKKGPAIAATDYMKTYSDQIRSWVPMPYAVLGTDGFGRSDTREALRDFFEVDERWITVQALTMLAREGTIPEKTVAKAIKKYGIDPSKPNPLTV
ncbi:MAG TPA: pyruvate dehydrogenase (acetyl-transferring), homodimeric type [Nevskiaceae bacterium]